LFWAKPDVYSLPVWAGNSYYWGLNPCKDREILQKAVPVALDSVLLFYFVLRKDFMRKTIGFALLFAFVVAMGLSAAPKSFIEKENARKKKSHTETLLKNTQDDLNKANDEVLRLQNKLDQVTTDAEKVQTKKELNRAMSICIGLSSEIGDLKDTIATCVAIIESE
jgi:uncharacterized protein YlxW (UPF0749 family)